MYYDYGSAICHYIFFELKDFNAENRKGGLTQIQMYGNENKIISQLIANEKYNIFCIL